MQTRITGTDIPIFAIKIWQKEGEVSLCDIVTKNEPITLPKHVIITVGDIKVFQGRVTNIIYGITPYYARVELKSNYANIYQRCLDLVPQPEVMFGDPDHPSDRLEGTHQLFHFDRFADKITLSDFTQGREVIDIGSDIFNYACSEQASDGVRLDLKAEWIKRDRDIIDVWSLIAPSFPGGQVATLTGKHLMQAWMKLIAIRPQTGYYVIESRLEEREIGRSAGFMIGDQKAHIKKTYFEGALKILAQSEHKYRECIQWGRGRKKITLAVPKLDEHNQSCFFATAIGQKWMQQAFNIVRSFDKALARNQTFKVTVPFNANTARVHLDATIQCVLKPMGEVKAKLVEYQIENLGKGYVVHLTMKRIKADYQEPVIHIDNVDAKEKEEEPWVEALVVRNTADDQNRYLLEHAFAEAAEVLVPPTTITMRLRKLNQRGWKERRWT